MTRRSPVRHFVRSHKRGGVPIKGFYRGRGGEKRILSARRVQVRRRGKWRTLQITLPEFIDVFNLEVGKVTARRSTPFDLVAKKIADMTGISRPDVYRIVAGLLRKSRTFKMSVWLYPSFSNKGQIQMKKAAGWAPREPFDTIALKKDITDVDKEKIVEEFSI